MFKTLTLLTLLSSGVCLAQNMAPMEDSSSAYTEMPDGSSVYSGRCMTHEDYEKKYFIVTKVLSKHIVPRDLTKNDMTKLLVKFDKQAIQAVLKAFDLYQLAEPGQTEADIFLNYVDDFEVEAITHFIRPELNLMRFSVGVGGGNGGYVILNKRSGSVHYDLISYTFDSELNYCDLKVWR